MIKGRWGGKISKLEMKWENVQTETRGKESTEGGALVLLLLP